MSAPWFAEISSNKRMRSAAKRRLADIQTHQRQQTVGKSKTWLFQTWFRNFYASVLFCALCALLRSFTDLRLRSFVLFRIRPRLERPRLGTAETAVGNKNSQTKKPTLKGGLRYS